MKFGWPAETAGLRPEYLLTRIEHCKIPGCPGGKAKAILDKIDRRGALAHR